MSEDQSPRGLERAGSGDRILWILAAAGLLSVVADLFYDKHGEYGFQEWLGFDALLGLVSVVGIALIARGLRVLLLRSEDYYD